jgi:hypothetical protein
MQDFINPQGTPRDHSQPLKKGDALWDEYFPPKKEANGGRKNEEDILQRACVKWFKNQYPYLWRCLYMVKNDGFKKKIQNEKTGVWFSPEANRDKLKALTPGIADLELMLPNKYYPTLYLELKTSVGSQSQEQILFEFIAKATGKKYIIIRTLDNFIYEITDYMKTVSPAVIEEIGRLEIAYQRESSLKAVKKLNK